MSAFKGIANPYSTTTNSSREGSTTVIEDNVTWVKGRHALTFGGSYTQAGVWLVNQQQVPTIGFGIVTGDPADSMFTTANFPGASTTDLTNARNLYAVLTGRVSSIGRNARIGGGRHHLQHPRREPAGRAAAGVRLLPPGLVAREAEPHGERRPPLRAADAVLRDQQQLLERRHRRHHGRDRYRAPASRSGSTVTGLGNLFQPGVLQGAAPTLTMLTADTNAYNTDKNNLAPSVGVAWTVGSDKGFLHTLLGSPG